MRRRHLISNTNYTADLLLWTHHPQVYNLFGELAKCIETAPAVSSLDSTRKALIASESACHFMTVLLNPISYVVVKAGAGMSCWWNPKGKFLHNPGMPPTDEILIEFQIWLKYICLYDIFW